MASPGSPRSGLPNPTARNPRSCRARICRAKPEASAQAPWTRTIVGLVSSGWVGMSAPCLRWGPAVREASPFHSVPARVIRPSRDLTLTRESLFTGMCGFPRGRDRAGSPARKGRGSPGTVGSALMSRWSSLRADSRTLQHPPEIDEKLLVDVLVPGPGDHLRLRPHRHPQLSIRFADHRADGLEQRHHLPPLHVAAGRMLVDLPHGFAVVIAQIRHRWLHWSMSGLSGIHIVVPSSSGQRSCPPCRGDAAAARPEPPVHRRDLRTGRLGVPAGTRAMAPHAMAARAGRVRQLLDEEQADVAAVEASIGYRLRRRHLGLVCWVPETTRDGAGLERLDPAKVTL